MSGFSSNLSSKHQTLLDGDATAADKVKEPWFSSKQHQTQQQQTKRTRRDDGDASDLRAALETLVIPKKDEEEEDDVKYAAYLRKSVVTAEEEDITASSTSITEEEEGVVVREQQQHPTTQTPPTARARKQQQHHPSPTSSARVVSPDDADEEAAAAAYLSPDSQSSVPSSYNYRSSPSKQANNNNNYSSSRRSSAASSLVYSVESSPGIENDDDMMDEPQQEQQQQSHRSALFSSRNNNNQQQQQVFYLEHDSSLVEESPPPSPVSTPPRLLTHPNYHHHHHPVDPPTTADDDVANADDLKIPSLGPTDDTRTKQQPQRQRQREQSFYFGSSTTKCSKNDNKNELLHLWQLSELRQQGFPVGLALEVGATKATYPCRFWLVDNSGSMLTADGHKVVHVHSSNNSSNNGSSERQHRQGSNAARITRCNRWTELQQAVEDHAVLAGLIQATTVFRLLNHPGANVVTRPEFVVADPAAYRERQKQAKRAAALQRALRHSSSTKTKTQQSSATAILKRSIEQDVEQAVRVIQQTRPAGATPLTPHLLDFRERIRSIEPQLRHDGQQAVVVIATDGLPTDVNGDETIDAQDEFVEAFKSLQNLPVWIVIRLCTDDRTVVDYYNNLDKMLELPLEVIDDFLGEAKEIAAANPWLNYALPMHRCREMGYHHRIFDLLDERPLTKDEVHEFLVILFGKKAMRDAPDIHTEWNDYYTFVSCINRAEGKHWRAQSKRLEHWIDMRRLHKMYGTTGVVSNTVFSKFRRSLRRRKGVGDRTAYEREEV